MALTQISENGVKTDAISHTKLADDSVGASELVDSSESANRAVTQNHIRNEAVDEARLQISNAGSNGQYLQKQSGNTGGLTWATVSIPDSDKIEEGNTSVETVDTGSDGHVSVKTEGTERLKIRNDGVVDIGGTGANTVNFNVKGTSGSGAGLTGDIGKVNIGSSYSNSPSSEGTALGQLIFGHGTNASGPIVEGSAGGAWSTNNLPSQLKFYTVPGSSATQTERLRISKDGALGISGANYGTSGQVLTSGGTSAAPSWAAVPPGGNTFTAVADGAIANNKAVQIGTDGKVSEIKQVLSAADATFRGNIDGSAGNVNTDQGGRLIFDPDQNRLMHFYADATYANDNMKYHSIKLDANKLPVQSTSGDDGSNFVQSVESTTKHYAGGFEWGDVCYDTQNNKYIWVCRDGNTDNMYTKAGTYNTSNHTITWPAGSSNMQQPNGSGNSGRAASLYFDHTTNRIVLGYRNMESGSPAGVPTVVIGSYNTGNGSIDWGTPVELSSNRCSDGDFEVCQAGSGTGKVAVIWRQITGGSGIRASLVTVSNSANSCTATTSQELRDNSNGTRVVYNSEDGNMIMISNDQDDSNNLKVTRLTINSAGNGFDVSSDTTVTNAHNDDNYWTYHDLIYNPTSKQVQFIYREDSTTHQLINRVTNTTGTPTISSGMDATDYTAIANILDNDTVYSIGCADPTVANTSRIYFINRNYQGKPILTAFSSHNSSSNLVHQNHYMGYADQAYTNGQTATIKTYGNTVSTLSGLTAGTMYYVQGDGGLGTTADSSLSGYFIASTPVAGTALSSTKLLIRDPAVRV